MSEKHLFFIYKKMSSRWSPRTPRDARKDVTPDVACKQSTSSVMVPSVSSVQKYKYMLSLLFFFLFTYLGRIGQKKKKKKISVP